jgi:hypothetical protein
LTKGGFHLTKWISNSRELLTSIPKEERAKEVKDLDLDQDKLPIERALGIQWSAESDKFCFKIVIKERQPTRRGNLSIMSSIYDRSAWFVFASYLICKIYFTIAM